MIKVDEIKFDDKGLVPAIVQNSKSNEVLMLGYMNQEALKLTLETDTTWFFSRSRNKLWQKGETSGNYLYVEEVKTDCDQDTILVFANPQGPTCHTGEVSCFFKEMRNNKSSNPIEKDLELNILQQLEELLKDRKANPKEGSYTNYLFEKGLDKILKKVGEETSEVIIGAKNEDPEEVIYEVSDLVYHVMVLLSHAGIKITDIEEELKKRYK